MFMSQLHSLNYTFTKSLETRCHAAYTCIKVHADLMSYNLVLSRSGATDAVYEKLAQGSKLKKLRWIQTLSNFWVLSWTMTSKPSEKEPLLQRSFAKPKDGADPSYGSAKGKGDVTVENDMKLVRMRRHITLPYAVGESHSTCVLWILSKVQVYSCSDHDGFGDWFWHFHQSDRSDVERWIGRRVARRVGGHRCVAHLLTSINP